MYSAVIQIHHYLSWLVLAALLFAILRAWTGVIFKKYWTVSDRTTGMLLTVIVDIQLLTGVILFAALSPVTRMAFSNFNVAIKDPAVRFFTLEHTGVMLLAVIFVHIGRSISRKTQFAARKHRVSAIYYTLAAALILSRIPWDRIFS